MEFLARLKDYGKRVERGLDKWVPAAGERPARLHQAMRHSLDAGGKRLRPVLLLAAADIFQRAPDDPLPAAAAVECLHTYSLIHDDLPCMDDSDLRRGRPACHRQFDEATAVLAGDALLTHAFWLLAEAYAGNPPLAADLVRELGLAAGSRHLIGGQMADMEAEAGPVSAEDLGYIHANKTAALFAAALVMGGRVGGADAGERRVLGDLGRNLGLAFQIVDDILDATGKEEDLGKTAGADHKNQKLTYPGLHGMEAARAEARRLTEEALGQCRTLPGDTSFLRELIGTLEKRVT